MRGIVNFFLTIAVFIAAWRLFPDSIIAGSYSDCVLAALVFFLVCSLIAFAGTGLILYVGSKISNISTASIVGIVIVFIIVAALCTPIGIMAATHFTNYAIVGKPAFVLFWFVLAVLTSSYKSNKKND